MTIEPFEVGGQLYDNETLTEHREQIIHLRDNALLQGDFQWSVILSHTVGILAKMIEMMGNETDEPASR